MTETLADADDEEFLQKYVYDDSGAGIDCCMPAR